MHPPSPSDPPLRRATLGGRTISWVETGPHDGPCVVMVHGLPGSHRDFRWLAAALEPHGVRVIRLDMPGFGQTAATSPELSDLATHLVHRLDHLELGRVVLLGHSFGGAQALVAAARDPDRVRGLALLASIGMRPHAGLRRLPGLPTISRSLRVPVLRRPLMRAVRAAFVRAGFSRSTPDAEIRRSLEVVSVVDFPLIGEAVRKLRAPTLLAYCEDDPLVEPTIGEQLGFACPSGPRLRFETGGHNPQKAWACEIAEALAPWVRVQTRMAALPPAP